IGRDVKAREEAGKLIALLDAFGVYASALILLGVFASFSGIRVPQEIDDHSVAWPACAARARRTWMRRLECGRSATVSLPSATPIRKSCALNRAAPRVFGDGGRS